MTAPSTPRTIPVAGFKVLPVSAPLVRRVLQLLAGLILFGVAIAFAVEPRLGASPWTVFHEGAAERVGLSIGTVISLVGFILLIVLWFLKEPLGLGTVLNVLVIGPVVDVVDWLIPDLESLLPRIALLAAAPVLLGLGSGLYLNAGVGPGPRDGIMTALNRRGIETWKARTFIELTALLVGFLLGGVAGLGTIWMALAIGPCVQFFLNWFTIDTP